jgi:hypothetical protein
METIPTSPITLPAEGTPLMYNLVRTDFEFKEPKVEFSQQKIPTSWVLESELELELLGVNEHVIRPLMPAPTRCNSNGPPSGRMETSPTTPQKVAFELDGNSPVPTIAKIDSEVLSEKTSGAVQERFPTTDAPEERSKTMRGRAGTTNGPDSSYVPGCTTNLYCLLLVKLNSD